MVETETLDGEASELYNPVGAFWWRWEGEHSWRPIVGRNPDQIPPPEGHEVKP